MPPKTKISREMIIEAAFRVIREQGHEQLNVRTVAEVLGCSTQPVMYNFKTVEALRAEAYRMADEFHSEYISPKGEGNPLLELGMNYTRFGYEEKNLFRFLFQANEFAGKNMMDLVADPAASDMVGMVAAAVGCSTEEARKLFVSLFASAHGIASLLANNAMAYETELFRGVLANAFRSADQEEKQ